MGDFRLLDNIDGVKTYHALDNGKTIIKTAQDVDPLLDINQEARSNQSRGWKGDMHHVASIPFVVYEQMLREIGYNWKQPMNKEEKHKLMIMLSSRDWAKLRTKEGRLA